LREGGTESAGLAGSTWIEDNPLRMKTGGWMNTRAYSYRDLEVWREGISLVESCYRLVASFPNSERQGLTSQMTRAAVSIPSNIAEGQSRSSRKEFQHHLSIAYGSLAELETQLEIAQRLGYVKDKTQCDALLESCDRIGRMLSGLRCYLKSGEKPAR
jgi:four helix bundle protein